jgi:hypothetical protein
MGSSSGRWLTVKEACEYGRWGSTKLYDLLNKGKGAGARAPLGARHE